MIKKAFVFTLISQTIFSCSPEKKKELTSYKEFSFNKESNRNIDNVAYALGVKYGHSSKEFMLDEDAYLIFLKGMEDGRNLKFVPSDQIKKKAKMIDVLVSLHRKKIAQKNKKLGKEKLLKLMKSKPSLIKHKSGIVYRVLKQGTPVDKVHLSKVKIKYSIHSFNEDRLIEDNLSKETTFPYKGMLKAWKLALSICGEGGDIEIYSPSIFAYGDEGSKPVIKPGEYLKFRLIFSSISF